MSGKPFATSILRFSPCSNAFGLRRISRCVRLAGGMVPPVIVAGIHQSNSTRERPGGDQGGGDMGIAPDKHHRQAGRMGAGSADKGEWTSDNRPPKTACFRHPILSLFYPVFACSEVFKSVVFPRKVRFFAAFFLMGFRRP